MNQHTDLHLFRLLLSGVKRTIRVQKWNIMITSFDNKIINFTATRYYRKDDGTVGYVMVGFADVYANGSSIMVEVIIDGVKHKRSDKEGILGYIRSYSDDMMNIDTNYIMSIINKYALNH